MSYNGVITETLRVPPVRARLVEAYLRLQYGTLDALSREDIKHEYRAGGIGAAIDADPKQAEALALSYGIRAPA